MLWLYSFTDSVPQNFEISIRVFVFVSRSDLIWVYLGFGIWDCESALYTKFVSPKFVSEIFFVVTGGYRLLSNHVILGVLVSIFFSGSNFWFLLIVPKICTQSILVIQVSVILQHFILILIVIYVSKNNAFLVQLQ